jgi:hypothetical protein
MSMVLTATTAMITTIILMEDLRRLDETILVHVEAAKNIRNAVGPEVFEKAFQKLIRMADCAVLTD